MRVQDLRVQLADLAGAVPPTPRDPIAAVMSRVRHHRRRTRALNSLLAAAVVMSGVAVWTTRGGPANHRVIVTPGPPAGTTTPAIGSAKDLAGFEWSPLPTPPIAGRSGASVAWTGREMVVWGGIANQHPVRSFTDGATYDPTSARWRAMATPPGGLAARFNAVTLWTGAELLVIGGTSPDASTLPANDGAYDPTNDSWRMLAKRPSDLTGNLTGVWTGQAALVLSSSRSAASYSPAEDRWHSLPPLPEPIERDLVALIPVWTADGLLVWVHWAQITTTGNPTTGPLLTTGPWGTDLWDFNPASNRWTEEPGGAAGLDNPIWTGTTVLFPAARAWSPLAGPGPTTGQRGLIYSPATNTYRMMAHGPVDDGARGGLWTGQALVRIAASDAAAWDPATDTWTRLKESPMFSYEDQLVWTGHEILSYGPTTSAQFAR